MMGFVAHLVALFQLEPVNDNSDDDCGDQGTTKTDNQTDNQTSVRTSKTVVTAGLVKREQNGQRAVVVLQAAACF